jgi:hypothetical protein
MEYELIQERNISGRGLLRVPTDVRKNRAYLLYADVIREPINKYLNLNYNPARSRYGALTFFRKDYLVHHAPIEFPRQVWDGVNDVCGQTLLAVKCAYDGVLDSLINLSIAISQTPGGLGLIPISKVNLIKDYENLRMAWDECRLVCYADTAIRLQLYRLQYDVCNPEFEKDKEPPSPPPPPVVPPGDSIEGIDDAYDEESDDGNTIPFPGDTPAPPPTQGTTCVRYNVLVSYLNTLGVPTERSLPYYGEIGELRRVTGAYGEAVSLEIQSRGPGGGACGEFRFVRFTGGNNTSNYNNPVIVSITPD